MLRWRVVCRFFIKERWGSTPVRRRKGSRCGHRENGTLGQPWGQPLPTFSCSRAKTALWSWSAAAAAAAAAAKHFSRVRLCVTPYMAAHQAPLSLEFSRQEHWSGLPFPSPELFCTGMKLLCLCMPVDVGSPRRTDFSQGDPLQLQQFLKWPTAKGHLLTPFPAAHTLSEGISGWCTSMSVPQPNLLPISFSWHKFDGL